GRLCRLVRPPRGDAGGGHRRIARCRAHWEFATRWKLRTARRITPARIDDAYLVDRPVFGLGVATGRKLRRGSTVRMASVEPNDARKAADRRFGRSDRSARCRWLWPGRLHRPPIGYGRRNRRGQNNGPRLRYLWRGRVAGFPRGPR